MAESFVKLSGSTDGKGVKVTGTSTAATVTVHTAQSGALLDIVTLFCENGDTQTRTLTIEWGAATDPDNTLVVPIPSKQGPVLVIDRLPITNSLVVKAFGDAANVLVVYGLVVRQS